MGWSLHHPNGLIYYASQSCYRGYTLFSNLRGYDANWKSEWLFGAKLD